MVVTATEFKMNMGKYLELVRKEDIAITKNGKKIGVLVDPGVNTIRSLKGFLKLPEEMQDMDYSEIREMRVREKNENND